METHYELYVKQNNRWILEANFQAHQREEAIEEAKQLGRQGHIQAVKVVREQRNPKSGLTRESTIYSTDRSKSKRDDDDEYGSSDPFADGDGGPRRGRGGDDDDDFEPDIGASTTASRAYGTNFAEMEIEVGGGRNWGDMDIPSEDDIVTHVRAVRRAPAARVAAAAKPATPMGPATWALIKLLLVATISIIIAAAITFMFQRLGLGGGFR